MRYSKSIIFLAAATFLAGAGCDVHTEPAQVGVSAGVSVDEPQGEVVAGPGVEAIDVDPDPAQRVYVYDEGYPPGTYTYNGYYYYGGYRYPRDVFVNQYVQENIRQHRFVNVADNRRQGQAIEQRHRQEFTKTHGVRQNRPAAGNAAEHRDQTPARKEEAPRPNNAERPENRPAVPENHPEARPENRPATPENRPEARPATPENRVEQPRTPAERPEVKPPANEERRPAAEPEKKANPAEAQHPAAEHPENKPAGEEPKREEGK